MVTHFKEGEVTYPIRVRWTIGTAIDMEAEFTSNHRCTVVKASKREEYKVGDTHVDFTLCGENQKWELVRQAQPLKIYKVKS